MSDRYRSHLWDNVENDGGGGLPTHMVRRPSEEVAGAGLSTFASMGVTETDEQERVIDKCLWSTPTLVSQNLMSTIKHRECCHGETSREASLTGRCG